MAQITIAEAKKFQHARGSVYFLLSKLFLEQPESESLARIADTEFFKEFRTPENEALLEGATLLQDFFEDHNDNDRSYPLDVLQLEYTRLFLGPDTLPAPPWESAYRSAGRTIFAEQTLEVRNEYRKFGLAFEKEGSEPDDHVGLELEFLSHLCKAAEETFEQGDGAKVLGLLEAQKSFFDEHVNCWASQYCEDLFNSATTSFYKGVAKFTDGFLQWDYLMLLELMEELKRGSLEVPRSE
jgi:TorA maturation chaperone TorD